jgi:hypothetical protein
VGAGYRVLLAATHSNQFARPHTLNEQMTAGRRRIRVDGHYLRSRRTHGDLFNKFIPVLRRGRADRFATDLPQEQDGVNLSAEPYSEDEYLKLLRVLHTGPGCLSHRSDFMEAFV